MDQSLKEELIEKWLKGSLTEEQLLQSISSEELNQYKLILNTVDQWIPDGSEEISDNLQKVFAVQKEAKIVSMGRTGWVMGIAASLLLLASVFFIFQNRGDVEYYAANGNLEILLPDKTTTVILSPGSKLAYSNFDVDRREVSINGRVYFDVTEKGPFEVNHEGGTIAVVGTRFEVIAYEEFFEATCFEGEVEVNHRGKSVNLRRKSRVVYARGALQKSQAENDQPGWISQEFEQFDNDPLVKVIKVIEGRYQVDVNAESISLDRRFTGSIQVDDLPQACRVVFTPLGINYSIQGKNIFLSE